MAPKRSNSDAESKSKKTKCIKVDGKTEETITMKKEVSFILYLTIIFILD
jgi:hypothetical protein